MKRLSLMALALMVCAISFAQRVSITFYDNNIVRVQKTMDDSFRETPGVVVTLSPDGVYARVSKGDGKSTYSTSALRVSVDNASGRVTFTTASGRRLLREGESAFIRIPDGFDAGSWVVGQSWMLDNDEAVYGLESFRSAKASQHANFFHSVKGYGIFWDNYSPTNASESASRLSVTSQIAEAIDYYFIYGKTADGVVSLMRKLSGRVPMLPLWSYGYLQSRDRYESQEELVSVVRAHRDASIPLDGIVLHGPYWGNNYLWNAMEFLDPAFADPKAMTDAVHAQSAHIALSVWPTFGPMTKGYDDMEKNGFVLDFRTAPFSGLDKGVSRVDYPSGIRSYDAFNEEARALYRENFKHLNPNDFDAFWMNSAQPDSPEAAAGPDVSCSAGSWLSMRAAYPLMVVENLHRSLARAGNDKRALILADAYFAGQQRTGAVVRSGESRSSWEELRKELALSLDCTMTGVPAVSSDIGGTVSLAYAKAGDSSSAAANPLFQELYVRWMQFGALSPMMRSHGKDDRRELWEFGKKGDAVFDALMSSIKLRYSLLPYIYSIAWQQCSNDASLIRPLVMDFAEDRRCLDMTGQYMFGPSILVAPVLSPLYTADESVRWAEPESAPDWSAERFSEVYLPAGSSWYEWQSGRIFPGGRTTVADASLSRIPMYVKAGSIIPIGPDVQYAAQKTWDNMEIRVYPGANGLFTLYEDQGDSYAYEKGRYSCIGFILKGKTLTIGRRMGKFEGMLQARRFIIVLPDGRRIPVDYNGSELSISL